MRIGVFDSGIGGITVLTELRSRFPGTQYVYLGDTANVPYGTRSPGQIRSLAAAAAARLRSENLDLLVVACNTAASLAMDEIRAAIGPEVPVFGVVEGGVRAVLADWSPKQEASSSRILVLATRATVGSQVYSRQIREALHARGGDARVLEIVEQACPLLVPMIEEGWLDHPVLHQTIKEYVGPHCQSAGGGIALLACTHYPWAIRAFETALPEWRILNSASAVADLVTESAPVLREDLTLRMDGGDPPAIQWIFTDPNAVPPAFALEFEKG